MFMKIIAASAFTVGLATAAMAQSQDYVVTPDMENGMGPNDTVVVDPNTTGSIYGGMYTTGDPGAQVNTGTIGPCASDWNSAGPDANANMTVNNHYCGK